MNRFSRQSGLSLLELLIALALLAMIAAGLAASMGLGIRLYERTTSDAELTDEIALRVRLRALLAAAEPPSLTLPFATGLSGGRTGFTFTTLAASQLFPDSAALRVSVSNEGETLRLELQALDDNGTSIHSLSRILATEVDGPVFSYFDDAKDPPLWLPEWTEPTRLPTLVRVTANPGSIPDWPEFTVRLRLGG